MYKPSDALTQVLSRMAWREANGHLTAASAELSLRIRVTKVHCPWCPDKAVESAFAAPPVPLFGWEFGWDWAAKSHRETELRVLTCERLTVRSLLPMAEAVSTNEAFRDAMFCTRAVTFATFSSEPLRSLDFARGLARLDQAESWADELGSGGTACQLPAEQRYLSLPASVHEADCGGDILDSLRRLRSPAAVHFLTPHLNTGLAAAMNGLYQRERLDLVAAALGRTGAL
jgi:hypothetical protein